MTTLRLLKNGAEAFPAMFEAIDRAQSSIALEMYIVSDDQTGREFRGHLIDAARRGVKIMVLIDAWGCWNLPKDFWDQLSRSGGTVRWFQPIMKGLSSFRNHRKLLLVDDRIAYLGGMNVADEYYRGVHGKPAWRDTMLEVSGSEVARLRSSFTSMWSRTGSPLKRFLSRLRRDRGEMVLGGERVRFLESGPENPERPVRKAYRQVIRTAEQRIDIAMGYFYPHGRLLRALKRAVRRGVRVRLLFSQKTDVPVARWAARGLYGRLLRTGVEVWEYLPSMMHAKLEIADDTLIVGSANLDIRSGSINYELVAIVNDRSIAMAARADFEDDLKSSRQISLDEWNKRPIMQKLKERISYFLLARLDILVARREMERKMQ
jgi:cardiolipin synthase